MNFLRAISRIIIGAVFLVSGFLKAIDPIGTSLKIKEYLSVYHLDFLDYFSLSGGILLSCLEFLIGIAILKGLRMRLFSLLCLILTLFFTVVTFVSAVFNPIEDCGCFGEAIHLTNWETFYKNLVLLACAALIYRQRGKFVPIATHFWQNLYAAAYFVFILFIALYSLAYLPLADFGSYKPGTDLIANSTENQVQDYETVLIYSKDGKTEEFTLDNIPDSTWTFVDSKSTLVSHNTGSKLVDLSIRNSVGEIVTDSILNLSSPVVFISFYGNSAPDKFGEVESFYNSIKRAGGYPFILNSSSGNLPTTLPVYSSDYKTLLSLNRNNGGATYVYEGVIIEKWSKYRYPNDIKEIFDEDPEIITANTIIREQLSIELIIAIIIFMVVIVRFISKRIYRQYLKKLKSEKQSEK